MSERNFLTFNAILHSILHEYLYLFGFKVKLVIEGLLLHKQIEKNWSITACLLSVTQLVYSPKDQFIARCKFSVKKTFQPYMSISKEPHQELACSTKLLNKTIIYRYTSHELYQQQFTSDIYIFYYFYKEIHIKINSH